MKVKHFFGKSQKMLHFYCVLGLLFNGGTQNQFHLKTQWKVVILRDQKNHFLITLGTQKVALCISDSSLFCQGAKHVVGVGETHPWFRENPEKVAPSKMSAKTQSKSTFSRKMRKHYESPVQLNPEKGKNLVLEQHFQPGAEKCVLSIFAYFRLFPHFHNFS